jgi:hypothetical protein
MMKATGSRPDDWLKAQLQLAKAALPDADNPQHTPLPLVPLARLQSLQTLLTHTASSAAAQATQVAAALPALAADPNTLQEAWALAGAALQRWWSLQAQCLEQWTALGKEMGQLRKVNTLSKYVGQEMDLVKQAQTLISDQSTSAVQLYENIVVDTSWWLSQKAQR